MIGGLKKFYQSFRGTGEASLAIPALDGAFRPNQAIEEATVLARIASPDNLAVAQGRLWFSSGRQLCATRESGGVETLETLPKPVTAIAGQGDALAVALEGGTIVLRSQDRQLSLPSPGDVTALCFDGNSGLVVCIGSATRGVSQWSRDLLEGGRSGSVWHIDLQSGRTECLAADLGYAAGCAMDHDGSVLVSESWKHRLIRLRKGKAPEIVVSSLPGYPSRIGHSGSGGFWVAVPAPLNQLVEFVLREDEFRRRMINEIETPHWIAPTLSPPDSFLNPMQQGAQRVLGMIKPWAPGMSYGLLVELDRRGQPIRSYHSRADGSRHGITSAVEFGDQIVLASKGSGNLLSMPIDKGVVQ